MLCWDVRIVKRASEERQGRTMVGEWANSLKVNLEPADLVMENLIKGSMNARLTETNSARPRLVETKQARVMDSPKADLAVAGSKRSGCGNDGVRDKKREVDVRGQAVHTIAQSAVLSGLPHGLTTPQRG